MPHCAIAVEETRVAGHRFLGRGRSPAAHAGCHTHQLVIHGHHRDPARSAVFLLLLLLLLGFIANRSTAEAAQQAAHGGRYWLVRLRFLLLLLLLLLLLHLLR